MSTTIDHGKALNAVLRKIKGQYEVIELPERSPLEEFIYSFLLWEASAQRADPAFKRLMNHVVDLNELRVCRPSEITAVLGKTYPLVDERAQRLKAALHEIYLREFAVSLDKCVSMNKRDARKYLETLEGMPPYVAARVVLTRLDGHAIPVDDSLLSRLVEAEALEPGLDPARAEGILERHIKAEDALKTHLLLQAWSDDPETEPKKPRVKREIEEKPAPAPALKKTVKKPAKAKA